eukprot:2591918-Amphidinium_carterae.1
MPTPSRPHTSTLLPPHASPRREVFAKELVERTTWKGSPRCTAYHASTPQTSIGVGFVVALRQSF